MNDSTNLNLSGEYISRVNRVVDYIDKNIDRQFTLDELASASSFSKYHFHRIFHAITGETPFQFITRLRLEKAASLLTASPKESITEIAVRCGFNDISVFSRNFRNHFKVTAKRFRKKSQVVGNQGQSDSNLRKENGTTVMYFCQSTNTIKWRTTMELNKSVEVRDLPRMTVAYVRHIGPYKGDSKLFEKLWNRLFRWAGPRRLIGGPDFRSLIIYHDDPNVTDEAKLRTSVCITVPPETKVDGEVGKMELEAARYMIARFEVAANQFQDAWDWVYGQWFPESGYQPDDKPCFEMYPEEPKDGKFIVDICVPVKPM